MESGSSFDIVLGCRSFVVLDGCESARGVAHLSVAFEG